MIRVTTVWTGMVGAPYYTNLYADGDTAGEADAANAAVVALWTDLEGLYHVSLTARVSPETEFVDPATGAVTGVESSAGGNVQGGAGDELLPPATQGLVRLRTGVFVAGREIRGRVFLPGLTQFVNQDGSVAVGTVSSVNTIFADYLTAMSGAGGAVVWSPTHGQAAVITSTSMWTEFAVLRTRRD